MKAIELSDKKGVQHIVLALARLGLREVILCPGSRDAPFIVSFNRHPAFHCISIRDERSAAFFALGKAIESGQPVAVVCTSGSAALNFAPAVSEAYYQGIPLIVITADRPKEWTDQGDGQTINQTDVYHNFIRKSYDLKGDALSEQELWFIDRCVSEGYNIATISHPGPVHFNVPLEEPLYATEKIQDDSAVKVFATFETEKQLSPETLSIFRKELSQCKKMMILAGQYQPDPDFQHLLIDFAQRENVVVLTESTSNMHAPGFIENIDRCITSFSEEDAGKMAPDLLITIGGAIVSKRVKAWLRKYRPRHHWNVDPFLAYMDTYQSLTRPVFMNPRSFFQQIAAESSEVLSDYRNKWLIRGQEMKKLHEEFCRECEYSDLRVFEKIYRQIPAGTYLHLSNSSPVRYAQLFDNHEIAGAWCNRGTSGIDGCSSTAMGAASASPDKNFLLITGDIAFQYDDHALWNDQEVNNLKIIVINNGGGNIFRIIPGPGRTAELPEFFETQADINMKNIALHYQWSYSSAEDDASLEEALKTFFDKNTPKAILEIFTDGEKNPDVLSQYWQYLGKKSEI